jgi:hypothetical protein
MKMPVENPTIRDMVDEWTSWQKASPLARRGAQNHGEYRAVLGEQPPYPYEMRTPRLRWLTTAEIALRLVVAREAAHTDWQGLSREERTELYDYASILRRAWEERSIQ